MPFNLPGPGPLLRFREVPETAAVVSEPVETFIATADYSAAWFFEADLEAFDLETASVDVTAAFFPPAVVEPVETFAAQPHYGEWSIPADETEDYLAPAEQNEWNAPPEAALEVLAAQPLAEQFFVPEAETEDYANDVALDRIPSFADTPVETFAGQVLAEQYVIEPDVSEDWTPSPEQNEWTAPPEVPSTELIAAQPAIGEWLPAEETEDYANDSLDTTPAFFPPVVAEPIETFAAQPLAEQWFTPAEEIEDYLAFPEQVEFLAPPEVRVPEILAAQAEFPAWIAEEQQTEDYQPETDAVPPFLFPTAAEPVETFAAQPHPGEWWAPEETEDYARPAEQNEWVFGTVPDAELAANVQGSDQPWFPADETEDYQTGDDITWFLVAPTEALIATYTFHPEIPDPEAFEDYHHVSALELAPFLAGPPVGPGPVRGPTYADELRTKTNAVPLNPASAASNLRASNAADELDGSSQAARIGAGKNALTEV